MRTWCVGQMQLLLVAAVVVAAVAACGTASPDAAPRKASELTAAGVHREEPPADALADATLAGMKAFGYDLFRASAEPTGNFVISPLSVAYAFAMARAGARGDTADQIDEVLRFPKDDVHAAFNAITSRLVTAPSLAPRSSPSVTKTPGQSVPPVLSIANAMFVQEGQAVRDEFLRILASQYGAGVQAVDFTSPTAIEVTDAWVREQTADRIKNLFDDLGPDTRSVLANAVYFIGDWALPFAEDFTTTQPFRRADGGTVEAPMMRQENDLRFATGEGWQAVELPYAESDLAMWVLVPAGHTMPAELLAPDVLADVATGLALGRVDLALPRWDFATNLDLEPSLQDLGMDLPFNPSADFSGMIPGVWIDQAVHRANITVDEWGTEAAAATGIEARQRLDTTTARRDNPRQSSVRLCHRRHAEWSTAVHRAGRRSDRHRLSGPTSTPVDLLRRPRRPGLRPPARPRPRTPNRVPPGPPGARSERTACAGHGWSSRRATSRRPGGAG
jgi:serine protease inhibitor